MDDKQSIVEIARKRYLAAKEFNEELRKQAVADTQFVMGDSENNWQWPEGVYTARAEVQQKPCLTINLTAQHCNQIINSIRQNRPAGRVLPVDNLSDPDTAEILSGMCRSIQSYSNADTAHDIGAEHAIYGGEGYWRVLTEYESDTSFDQVITIKPLVNPQLVYIDPDAIEPDRSDAKWGMIFEDLSREQCKLEFPDLDVLSWAQDGLGGWVGKDTVRIADYYWCENEPDTLMQLDNGTVMLKSTLPDGARLAAGMLSLGDGQVFKVVNQRETKIKKWYYGKLVGGETEPVDKRDWMGSLLPIITVVGKEINVNGKLVRKGLVRDLKDPARMVNYSYSASVETIALQNKVPYIAAEEAIEGKEALWGAANQDNLALLTWRAHNADGTTNPMPQRQPPAMMPTAQVQMLQLSTEEMRAASGQQNANFGIKSEAQSGVGIQRLKAQGEVATFHFPDNLARALTYEMRVLIDLIPKIYDTKRIVRILGLDGKESKAILDPEMKQPYAETRSESSKEVDKIFNPLLGRYDVVIDTGPSYHTQRQEAADTLTELTSRNPQIMQVAGDIVMRSYDFPMAEEMAKRLEKTLPPGLKDEEGEEGQEIPPAVQQQMQQMMEQIQQLSAALENADKQADEMEAGQAQKELSAQMKLHAEQVKRMELEIELERTRAIGDIKDAQQELERQSMQSPVDSAPKESQAPQQTQQPTVLLDTSGQLAGTLGPVMESLAASIQTTGEAVSMIAQGQQQLMQEIAVGRDTDNAILFELQKPKVSQVRIVKQADGSFAGERVEQ